jgi:hypothetical protein
MAIHTRYKQSLIFWVLFSMLSLLFHAGFAYKIPSFDKRGLDSSSSRNSQRPPRLQNVTLANIDKARAIVKYALEQSAVHNKARIEHPARNNYQLMPGTKISKRDEAPPPPLFQVTPEIAEAAALVAEADAVVAAGGSINSLPSSNSTMFGNQTASASNACAQSGTFWMEKLARKGSWPFNSDPSYTVRDLD